jgi:hypothetical protein
MIRKIPFEQAVFGTFPFWHRGYAVLARSAGCRHAWLDALRLASQRFGEPPPGVVVHDCLFAFPLPHGPWMIVGVFPQGCDDQGRPGALAFHGLFVGRWYYFQAGCSPFPFSDALRGDWNENDQDVCLPTGTLVLKSRRSSPGEATSDGQELIQSIVEAMKRGQRVVYHSSQPIDVLARRVWKELPGRVRRKASVATWVYRNENHFDLLGVPRTHRLDHNGSGLVLGTEPDVEGSFGRGERHELTVPPKSGRPWRRGHGTAVLARCLLGLLVIGTILGLWHGLRDVPEDPRFDGEAGKTRVPARSDTNPRDLHPPQKLEEPLLTAAERLRLAEVIEDMADRFFVKPEGPFEAEPSNQGKLRSGQEPDLGALMARLSSQLRYRRENLSPREIKELREVAETSTNGAAYDAALALRWHALIRRFTEDRRLPDDFALGPTRWQLATLTWSYHLDQEPEVVQALSRGSVVDVVHALTDSLMVNVPLPETSLVSRFPALEDYRRFLATLPRK